MPLTNTVYTVDILRSGQPRPYADTEREYLITVQTTGCGKDMSLKPWLMYGDLEPRIAKEEAARKAGTMMGGETPDQLRKGQREWAKKIIRALCQDFRETGDDDGRKDMSAYFYPTLRSLVLDGKTGTIRVFIVEPFTD